MWKYANRINVLEKKWSKISRDLNKLKRGMEPG